MRDLTAGEVTLKVDGRARDIRSFQFVRLDGGGASPARVRAPTRPLPPPFGTNALDDAGRIIVIILETDSIRANIAQQATSAAAEFVAGLSPRDWVGLVTMPYGGILVEPTRDHERVIKTLPTIMGQASQQTTDSDKGCRTRDTLNALANHLNGLAHLEGPKTIVFISSGMLVPRRDAPMSGPPGPCEIRSAHYDEVGTAASLARANVYVVKPDDFVIDSARNAFVDPTASRFRSSDEELAGIESLAGVTSGVLLRLTPSDRSAFARIARESAGYYQVGFEPIDRSVTLASAAFGLIDQRGRLVAQWTANARELGALPVMSAGLASPGRYRMKVAAIDTTGRRGSADYELLAEAATSNGLTMSTMVLGVSYERNFVPKLQFVDEPTANGSFEIFGSPTAGTLSVSMELATADDRPALVRVPGAIVETADTNRRRASGVVPIGQLAPGDYVLRAIVSLDGRPITTLTRILRKAPA